MQGFIALFLGTMVMDVGDSSDLPSVPDIFRHVGLYGLRQRAWWAQPAVGECVTLVSINAHVQGLIRV